MEILLIKYIRQNWKTIHIAIIIAVITPITIGFVLNIPTGHLTIGDENSWVGFFGSYMGGIIGGIVALIISSSQLINERKKFNNSQRSYLSAAILTANFSEQKSYRKKKSKTILTPDYTNLEGKNYEINYYSVIRYGGPDVITNCQFKITVGNDMKFENIAIIEVWFDFFEKDEEILIPLCSNKLSGQKKYAPFVKEIEVTFDTLAGEKINFYQSEQDKKSTHKLVSENSSILVQNIQHTTFETRE
ncbi:hypothetical protein P9B39_15870 [Bacillus altitudinis]|uniref:hypothetical protein n=1 Tax=Bacillus altitudinis TaxID=293387 RepID=UPI002DBE7A6C|nr:hypothetical protein [Bacillus altitudinis]MEC1011717.1 hypothetical protein [Bacillus altitudinis]